MSEISNLLASDQFSFINSDHKAFIAAFDNEMAELGYGCSGKIGDGYCWGRFMLIYKKLGAKSKQVYARVYIREDGIVLRLFLNDIDEHRLYVEKTPTYIKDVFTGPYGDCKHCHNEKNGVCRFRKTYTLDDRYIEKCNGYTFEFHDPTIDRIPDYIRLFTEFYPCKATSAAPKSSVSIIA